MQAHRLEFDRQPTTSLSVLGLGRTFPPSLHSYVVFSKIYSEDERRDFSRSWNFLKTGMGYYIPPTPNLTFTIGYAIGDSPLSVLG